MTVTGTRGPCVMMTVTGTHGLSNPTTYRTDTHVNGTAGHSATQTKPEGHDTCEKYKARCKPRTPRMPKWRGEGCEHKTHGQFCAKYHMHAQTYEPQWQLDPPILPNWTTTCYIIKWDRPD